MPPICPWFAATLSQDVLVREHDMYMTRKCLSLLETRSKRPMSRRNFAVACPPFGRKIISEIAQLGAHAP
jgi:hypothetical protein